jgi:hypothetical protein
MKDEAQRTNASERYVIWSEEHGAWWAPHASGYSRYLAGAGRYTKEQAAEIVATANRYSATLREIAFAIKEDQ